MTLRDPAAGRFAAIQLVRIGGVAMFVAGLLIHARRFAWTAQLPRELAYGLMALGLAGVFVLPAILARRWRSPRA